MEPIKLLNRYYKDRRGIRVHVIAYNSATGMVIYRRDDYEHLCSISFRRFRKDFTRIYL